MTLQERLRELSRIHWTDGIIGKVVIAAADALDAKDERIKELEGALRDCLAKGSRWHSCDPIVVRARKALDPSAG